MDFFLTGKGRVGTALISYFKSKNIALNDLDESDPDVTGILFAALPDDHLLNYINKIRNNNKHIHIVHFSGSLTANIERCYLFHPYASINKDTDISDILFTLWGKKNPTLEAALSKTGLNFIYAGTRPTPFYHISAVLSGNFTQFFFVAALELLKQQGFSHNDSIILIKQLVASSIENCAVSGTTGITGPAARGELNTVEAETEIIAGKDDKVAEAFSLINNLIFKAVRNGAVFK